MSRVGDIGDHPDIACALRTGYPRDRSTAVETARVKVRRCDWCEAELEFRGTQKWVCENEGCESQGISQ